MIDLLLLFVACVTSVVAFVGGVVLTSRVLEWWFPRG